VARESCRVRILKDVVGLIRNHENALHIIIFLVSWKFQRTRRCEDNIKICKVLVCEDVDWLHLAQYRVKWRDVVNTVINLRCELM
jgi:hypothetical protein